MLAIPSREQLIRMLGYMLDENEFLSPHGIRSVSRYNQAPSLRPAEWNPGLVRRLQPGRQHHEPVRWQLQLARADLVSDQLPASIEALERYHHFYGETLKDRRCPTGSGQHDEPRTRLPPNSNAGSPPSSCPDRMARALMPHRWDVTRTIRSGAITCSSTNISTATTGAALGRSIRPAGRRLSRTACAVCAEAVGDICAIPSFPSCRERRLRLAKFHFALT